MTEAHIYTVGEITANIRNILEGSFQEIWVEGEISNLTVASSGHMYFSLKDKDAVLSAVLFKSSSRSLKFDVEDGTKVLCFGRVSVYDKRGQYQLYVNNMEPKGKGSLQLAFEQLKKKLQTEGLFDEAQKKDLPVMPLRVAVVTSPTGAAIRDVVQVSKRRYSNIEITIRPAQVQGDKAKNEIAEAIKELNEYNDFIVEKNLVEHPIDVIIVGRGGGSIEDLWAFNEEIVARAIYNSEIPIISAVGHEIDFTISDFVSDLRAPTPSAAAELVVPSKKDLRARIEEIKNSLVLALEGKLHLAGKELHRLKTSYAFRAPINVIEQFQQELDDLSKASTKNLQHLVEIKNRDLALNVGKLEMLSPLAVMDRGYSITFKGQKAIKDIEGLKKGDLLNTKVKGGEITSTVQKTRKG